MDLGSDVTYQAESAVCGCAAATSGVNLARILGGRKVDPEGLLGVGAERGYTPSHRGRCLGRGYAPSTEKLLNFSLYMACLGAF